MTLAITAGYLLLCLLLGLRAGRGSSRNLSGFVAGDRALGLVVMYFITGASVFSAFAFLGGPGWAYSRGAASFYILAYGTLGMLPFYFLAPRAHRLGNAFGFVTQAELVGARFSSRRLAMLMAAISVAAFVPYLALQIRGAGYVLEVTSNGQIPSWIGSAAVYGVVLAYTTSSGVLGVGWTNTLQGLFMMVLAWGLGLYLPTQLYGGVGPLFERIAESRPELLQAPGLDARGQPWTWSEYGSAVLVSMIGFSAWPHLFMKAFSARDEATLRRTVVLFPTFHLFLIPLFIIGFCGVLYTPAPEQPDQILPHMLMHSGVSPVLIGLFCSGALAASMSSGDAMAHAAGAILVRDGLQGLNLSPERERTGVRAAITAVIVAGYVMAVAYRGTLVSLLLTTYGAVVQFAPLLVVALYVPRIRATVATAALLTGVAVTALFIAWPDLRPASVHAGLYGLAANVAILALGPRGACPGEHDFLAAARAREKSQEQAVGKLGSESSTETPAVNRAQAASQRPLRR